jgi:hypothetical protein
MPNIAQQTFESVAIDIFSFLLFPNIARCDIAWLDQTLALTRTNNADSQSAQQRVHGLRLIIRVMMATHALEALPLGREHLMSFELVPLGPLSPMRRLLPGTPAIDGARPQTRTGHPRGWPMRIGWRNSRRNAGRSCMRSAMPKTARAIAQSLLGGLKH